MALYDDRMADLMESRRSTRRAHAAKPSSMRVQSLLFSRSDGWTAAKAKAWAKTHDYKHGTIEVDKDYVRVRQFSPKGLPVKRTITLGRGIRAVVAREEDMATKKASRKRTTAKAKRKPAARKRTTRRTRETASEAARPKRRKSTVMTKRKPAKRKATKRKATKRRRVTREAVAESRPKRRRAKRRTTARAAAPKRRRTTKRRRTSTSESWYGQSRRHSKAAKKGHARRRRRHVSEAPKRRRSYARASKKTSGMGMGEFALALFTGGLGFVLADGVDRLLATYNPASTEEKPKDKFTSDGAGTLANTLNVSSAPNLMRIGAGVGLAAVPAIGSRYVNNPYARSALTGAAIGSFVSLFKMLWNGFAMPMLAPKDTSAAGLQKSYVARLYPAEVAATLNRKQSQTAVSSGGGAGALSGPPSHQAGVGAPKDVGPYALSGDSPYPDAAEALRQEAGMAGPGGDFPTVQNVWGTGEDYPTAQQAMIQETGRVGEWEPGPPSLPGPGPQAEPGEDASCACLGDEQYSGFVGDDQEADTLYATG